jgi:NAD(P)-dependent dehydrogenase (short-subunit alcohol dehydrogenase family)
MKFSRSVEGRRVIVTAGASGIGLAIAESFAAEGAQVCVADVSAEQVEKLRARNASIDAVVCDVGDPQQVASLFQRAAQRWDGRLDVLVNNAGISGPVADIEKIRWEDWERTLRVNVGGMFLCIQAAIPLWRTNGGGAAINISSSSARTGMLRRLPYVVSKVAVHGLTLNVARELGPSGVSCNALLPGMIDNERGRALTAAYAKDRGMSFEQALEENLRYISMRAVIDPREVAAMCLHLGSPAGAHISGQLIGVCGNAEWE